MKKIHARRSTTHDQRGVTLVELMVALAIGLVVAIAAVAALIIGRIGFTSVDSSTQLRENARFAASVMQRVIDESGFQDIAGGQFPDPSNPVDTPSLQGYDNASIVDPTATLPASFPAGLASGTRPANCGGVTDTSCLNGSDILVVRYWGVSMPPGPGNPPDGSVVNCAGGKEPERATGPSYSVFSVAVSSSGEPTLVCSYQDVAGKWTTVPLVTGVEGFQVLYGTFGIPPGGCSLEPLNNVTHLPEAEPTETYLTATQMDPGGVYCANNWKRVSTLRIGLLIRGPANSAVAKAATAATIQVLSAPNAPYSFATDADVGSSLVVPADGRLRQQVVYNLTLRNLQQTR